ncbi:HlyD family efflux transporter periplasmic adaptor subunit [Acetobacter musti]|uniref:HlyD family efflux transporter periplasmic adaptor subunit n=1 Tax=Acetobacter musti TaxID=864732 RepID=A0ABX0JM51_9PROT|nr:efflux RND transporter periplasmic adaptor subunit [Acetobacter musti]NHN84287.1 HlyD family efflux transporter periplasmic adaptor subunit [Acetobacter musti]
MRNSGPMRLAWLLPATFLAIGSARAALPDSIHMSATAQANENVRTVTAQTGRLRETLSAMARVDVDTARSVAIRPAGEGKVLSVLVTPGQMVRRNQTLMTYVDHSLHILAMQEQQARAGLSAAQAAQADARLALQRGRVLSGGALSTGEVRRRQAVASQAGETVLAREADIGMITHRLQEEFNSPTERVEHEEDSALISPVDGVVRSVTAGIATDIGPQTVVLEVVDLSSVWVVADIPPEDASRIAVGNLMRLRRSGDTESAPVVTRITTIDAIANPATGLIHVIGVANSGTESDPAILRLGTMLDATLDTTREAEGLRVPAAALGHMGSQDVIFVRTGPETFVPRTVKILLQTDDAAIVQGAVAPGDHVVTDGSFALKSIALMADSDQN